MNDNAKKWVAALRSGEFKQGKSYLRAGDGFCCLGLACELFRINTDGPDWQGSPEHWRYLDKDRVLPDAVGKWIGLRDSVGLFGSTVMSECKSHLGWENDHGKTFAEIADIIESEPPGLFADSETREPPVA